MGSQRGGEGSKQGLVDTIQGLQRALERSRKECQAAVSSAKYMQVTVYILHTHTLLFCLWLTPFQRCKVIGPCNCSSLLLKCDCLKFVPEVQLERHNCLKDIQFSLEDWEHEHACCFLCCASAAMVLGLCHLFSMVPGTHAVQQRLRT